MKKTGKEFHAFLTHNWSNNEDGCNNHEIVSRVNRELQSYGLKTWFDEERMIGSIQKIMADGIEQSDVAVVFITKTYIEKVNQGDTRDNCCYEFGLANRRLGSTFMIPVCMEKRLQNPNLWTGIVGGCLGGSLYVDMTEHLNESVFKRKCVELKDRILRIIGEDVSNYRIQNYKTIPLPAPIEAGSTESCSLCSCWIDMFQGKEEEKSVPVETKSMNVSAGEYSGYYVGEVLNGQRHGKGKITYTEAPRKGNEYEGEWKKDRKHGHGVYKWADGHIYEGNFKDGKFDGHGVYKHASGDIYEGNYKDDKRNGHGVLKLANGNIFEGNFKDGEFVG